MTSSRWASVHLGEVADLVNGDRGRNYPSQADRVQSGVPFINAGHLDAGVVRLESMNYISRECYDALASGRVLTGDVLLCIRGSLGRVALVTKDMVPGAIASSLVILRPGPALEPQFLTAYLMSPMGREMMATRDNGSAQPNIGARDVARFPLPLPPLRTQRKMAAILSAYDDLIENNTRRIKILEEMAQRIYREWFVEFRYPGHEEVPLVDSHLGPIPSGWETRPFVVLADYMNGYAFTPEDWGVDGLPIVKIKELKNGIGADTPRHLAGNVSAKYLVVDGDLLFSWSADLDAYLWAEGDAWLNQHLFKVTPAVGVPKLFLYHALRERMGEFRLRSQGTTMRHIKRSALTQVETTWPPTALSCQYQELVEPIDQQRSEYTRALRNLRSTRDLLLPRLISGEIDVENLDIDTSGLAA